MTLDKAIERVRKYLQLATSSNEHEAAQAAARAAALMAEYNLSEAMLRVEDTSRAAEKIVDGRLDEIHKKRVAWKAAIATAVASTYGCKTWWLGPNLTAFGRESATQAWNYTSAYLFRTVDELAEARWEAEKSMAEAVGQNARKWKNAFRVGAAATIAGRLYAQMNDTKAERKETARAAAREAVEAEAEAQDQGRENLALALIEKDEQEVETAYAKKTKGWRSTKTIGKVSSRSGYHAGKEAGAGVSLGGGRAGLPAGQGRLK